MSTRRVGAAVAALGLTLLIGLAWRWVPWEPVAGGLPVPAKASSVFSAAEIGRSEDFSATARWLGWSSYAASLGVLGALGFSRAGRLMVTRVRGAWLWQVAVTVVAVELLVRVITLPWSLAARSNRLEFGLTNQPLPAFLGDLGAGFLIRAIVTILAVAVIVGCARRWSRWWPGIAGLALGALILIASFAYPVVIEPVFNDFESLPAGSLRSQVLALAQAEGVSVGDVLVSDASRRTTSLNAYVSGYGPTRRVVLYDTLVADAPPEQVLAVVAHELAHARHDDVWHGSVLGALGVVSAVGLLGLVLPTRSADPSRWGWPAARDPAVVPLVLALTAMASLVVAPVQNGISRRIETRADVVALAATGDATAAENLQRSLALRALSDPTPPRWSQLWFGTHPTALERIALARRAAQ